VGFRDRPELGGLLEWCAAPGRVAARLVTGSGGAGKTRLALRLGQEMAANGWQSLWVPRGPHGSYPGDQGSLRARFGFLTISDKGDAAQAQFPPHRPNFDIARCGATVR
jgi:hypothetical protein